MSGVSDQPPPTPRSDRVPIWDLVICDFERRYADFEEIDKGDRKARDHVVVDMRERDRLGRERYGTPLTADNGRDQLVDAYQEMLDGVVYLRAALQEGGSSVRGIYYTLLQAVVETRRVIDDRGQK